jgi:hypothetical protein
MAKLASQVWFEEVLQSAILGEGDVPAALLIFALKSRFATEYREVKHTEISGINGDPLEVKAISIDASTLDPEQRELVKQALLAAKNAAHKQPITIDNEPNEDD